MRAGLALLGAVAGVIASGSVWESEGAKQLPAKPDANSAWPCTVAVLNFETKDKPLADACSRVPALLAAHLAAQEGLVVVEREELAKVLSEQELALSGTVDPATAAKAGKLTGAKALVAGSMFAEGAETVLVARIVSTETSRLFAETVRGDDGTPLTTLVKQLGDRVAASLKANRDAIVATAETREEYLARLRGLLGDKHLPSVSVRITETHNRQAVVDPAAETEISAILKELGFVLLEPSGSSRADVGITGEALSEMGTRRGGLVFCRGRVEVKAVDRRKGTILAVDSQTEGAMDLGEQIAGKTALQKAAARWLERNVAKLVGD